MRKSKTFRCFTIGYSLRLETASDHPEKKRSNPLALILKLVRHLSSASAIMNRLADPLFIWMKVVLLNRCHVNMDIRKKGYAVLVRMTGTQK
ncbi:hypothetical protein, partial [Xenorhabdus bovienii]|uniref:hypothetical protein n=1 Tax=Xenorhabdus bovienii TaxID=40576 RepID=UPI001E49B680